jgi:hypothetical protein
LKYKEIKINKRSFYKIALLGEIFFKRK